MFLRSAIAAGARYLVSRDYHLLNLSTFRGVLITSPEEFMEAWRGAHMAVGDAPAARRWRIPWRRKR
jgi:hypothetical protein